MFQSDSIKLELGEQDRRNDHYISESLKRLSQKAFRVARDSTIPEITARRKKMKNYMKDDQHLPELYEDGVIVRSGDVVKFGRVPYLIKESSVDVEKKTIEKVKLRRKIIKKASSPQSKAASMAQSHRLEVAKLQASSLKQAQQKQ